MSSGTMAVRFPDGTVRWGIFHGTSGLAFPALFASRDEAWDHRKVCNHRLVGCVGNNGVKYELRSCAAYDEGAGVPVECWTNYGGEWTWEATATETHLTSNHEAEGERRRDHTPDWVPR